MPLDIPSPRTISALARTEPISDEEWLEFIERRRVVIQSCLQRVGSGRLGHLRLQKRYTYAASDSFAMPVTLEADRPEVDLTNLSSRGVFYDSDVRGRTRYAQHRRHDKILVWGILTSGQWVLAEVDFTLANDGEHATRVEVNGSSPQAIVSATGLSYQEIWQELGRSVREWAKERRRLVEDLNMITRVFEVEDRVIEAVMAK